jgi:hypothetical protein
MRCSSEVSTATSGNIKDLEPGALPSTTFQPDAETSSHWIGPHDELELAHMPVSRPHGSDGRNLIAGRTLVADAVNGGHHEAQLQGSVRVGQSFSYIPDTSWPPGLG